LVVHAPKTARHRSQPRTVRLLAPLAQDLREWRLSSGRPSDRTPVIPALDGSAMSENAFEMWRSRAWTAALEAAGAPYQRPYAPRIAAEDAILAARRDEDVRTEFGRGS
jgi:integrase